MRVFAIGDVQGCATDLDRLLEQIDFDERNDRLWFVGDLVNRGPDSLGVLRRVRELGEAAVTVLGNHDLHLLAMAYGKPGKDRSNFGLNKVLDASDAHELLSWLRHRPLIHHDRKIGFTLVHAGLPPQWSLKQALSCGEEVHTALRGKHHGDYFAAMYGNKPDLWSASLNGTGRLRFITNCLTRIRYVDRNGRLDMKHKGAPGSQPNTLSPWYAHPKRKTRKQRIVFGHWSTLGYRIENNAYATDTGCLWGGELSALRLHPDVKRYKVSCKGVNFKGTKR